MHTVKIKINLIANQEITLLGRLINIHEIISLEIDDGEIVAYSIRDDKSPAGGQWIKKSGASRGQKLEVAQALLSTQQQIVNERHNTKTLPIWAQKLLDQKEHQIANLESELERTRAAHCLLLNHEWFTLQGPDFLNGEETRKLWFLDKDQPHPACSLSKGDILLIGRAIDKDKMRFPLDLQS